MNNREFREKVIAFMAKAEVWMQQEGQKTNEIDGLRTDLPWIRGKLEGKQE